MPFDSYQKVSNEDHAGIGSVASVASGRPPAQFVLECGEQEVWLEKVGELSAEGVRFQRLRIVEVRG